MQIILIAYYISHRACYCRLSCFCSPFPNAMHHRCFTVIPPQLLRFIFIVDFVEVPKHKKLKCFSGRLVLLCNKTLVHVCGYSNIYKNYFCFYNTIRIRSEHVTPLMYASVLIVYQVMQNIGQPFILKEFQRYIGYDSTPTTILTSAVSFDFTRFSGPIWSYRYTVQTYYGYGIQGIVDFKHTSITDRSIMSFYDGPLLVSSFGTAEQQGKSFIGGFLVRLLLKIPRGNVNGTCLMSYRKYRHKYTYFKLTNVGETYNVSVNTMAKAKGEPFYYKYIAVAVSDGFVKLTMRNIRTLSGGSYRCEYGGFAISNLWIHHLNVIGPYCTQYGTEPLVNDVRTFYSSKSYLTFLVYSYTFLLDIDISFERTPCEAITNPCSLYCWTTGFPPKQPKNYEIFDLDYSDMCKLKILIKKRCVILQRTTASKPFPCWVTIDAKGGRMDVILQTQNTFR